MWGPYNNRYTHVIGGALCQDARAAAQDRGGHQDVFHLPGISFITLSSLSLFSCIVITAIFLIYYQPPG